MVDLSGRTAVVTGAGSGIGRAIALRLSERGANLALLGRRLEKLETVAGEARGEAICASLDVALRSEAFYVGALGSRRSHAARCRRLRERGFGAADLARVHGPIGLDIGARTPEETAVSICAEIIARRTGRRVPSLRDGSGDIHS